MGHAEAGCADRQQSNKNILCWKRKSSVKNENTKKAKLETNQKLSLLMLAIGDFLSVCALSIISPFFPAESARKGVSASISGLIFAVYALVVFVSSPIFGMQLPKIGAKPMFVFGAFVAGISNVMFGFIDRLNTFEIFVAASFTIRIVEALGASAHSVAAYVLVVDIFPDNIGTVRGLLETCVGLGLSAGPGIGGLLYGVGGFGLPFFVCGGIALFVAVVNVFILRKPQRNEFKPSGTMLSLIRLPPVLITCMITTLAAMSGSFLDPTLEPHMRKSVGQSLSGITSNLNVCLQFGLSPSQVGLLFLLSSATYGLCSPLWGWLSDRIKHYSWLMTTGLFGSALVLLLLGPSPLLTFLQDSVWLKAVALGGLGVSTAMTVIPTYQFMLDSAVNRGFAENLGTHGMISGLWGSVYSLGEVIGPILGGTLMDNFNFSVTATVLALLNFLLAIIALVYFKLNALNSKADKAIHGTDSEAGGSAEKCGQKDNISCVRF
ncbi:hypothetical protein HUJ05_005642 [Dendroctonus ponderosae]|nr:hypothetical protein HUJ05_005642 [Dendroctonus ponderosae]